MSAGEPGTVTWRVLVGEAAQRLEQAGILTPDVDARRIVEQASGFEGAELVLGLDEPATQRSLAFYDAMLERRLAGEPLQYVLGRWGFRTLDLFVDPRVLIPRPETEVVVEVALGELDRRRAARGPTGPLRVVDLGTGSGAIALSIAVERPKVEVWATDVSTDALDVARANLAGVGRAGTGVRLVAGSWFEALPTELAGELDLVVSNPPYVADCDALPAEVASWEPGVALFAGREGTDAFAQLVPEAARWLAPGASLVVEMAPTQAHHLEALARGAGFADVRIERDLAGRERVMVAVRPVSS